MCRYLWRYCNSQQGRHYRRVSTGGSLNGWRLFWFWRLTVKPRWDYLTTSKIAPVSSCNCLSSKTVWTAQPDVTHQSSILSMKTVLDSPILASATGNVASVCIIHPDWTLPLTVCSAAKSLSCTTKTKLTINYFGLVNCPVIITHCAPVPIVVKFRRP